MPFLRHWHTRQGFCGRGENRDRPSTPCEGVPPCLPALGSCVFSSGVSSVWSDLGNNEATSQWCGAGASCCVCPTGSWTDSFVSVSLVATNMTDGVVATFQKQCAVVPGDTNGWILSGKPARDSCDKAGTSSKEEGNRGRLAVADRALETGKGAVAVMEAAKIHGMEATGADSHSPPANVQESSQSSMLCTCMYDPPPTKTPPPYCTKRIASSPRFLARLQLSVSSVKGGAGWEVPWTQVRSSGPELHAVVVMDGERRGVH